MAHPWQRWKRFTKKSGTGPSPSGQPVKRSAGCGVAAPGVGFANGGGGLLISAEERVDQSRLPHPGRSQQRDGLTRLQPQVKDRTVALTSSVDRLDDQPRRQTSGGFEVRPGVGREVGLGDYHDRGDLRLPGNREIPFQARRVELLIGRGHEKHGIDIGRDQLDLPTFPGILPLEQTSALEHPAQSVVGIEDQPVTDGRRRIGSHGGHPAFEGRPNDLERVAVHRDHANQDDRREIARCNLGREVGIPSQFEEWQWVAGHPRIYLAAGGSAPSGFDLACEDSINPLPKQPMTDADNHDITQLLDDVRHGVPGAADQLANQVSGALHRIAEVALRREAAGHTLQPTELVDEAFVKLVGQQGTTWQNRSQFYGVAARVIRRILIDHARRRRRAKRDHGIRVTLDESIQDGKGDALDLLALDDALTRLDALAPRQARVVELRFFGGLEVNETAEALDISPATVKRDWTFARAFLLQALGPSPA